MHTSIKYKSALYLASEALVSDKEDKVMPLSNHSQNISKSNEIGQNYAIQLFGNNPGRAKHGAFISQKQNFLERVAAAESYSIASSSVVESAKQSGNNPESSPSASAYAFDNLSLANQSRNKEESKDGSIYSHSFSVKKSEESSMTPSLAFKP